MHDAAFSPRRQVAVPKLQERKIAEARRKRQRIAAAAALAEAAQSLGSLVDASGALRREAVAGLFDRFDTDDDGAVDTSGSFLIAIAMRAWRAVCDSVASWHLLLALSSKRLPGNPPAGRQPRVWHRTSTCQTLNPKP